MQIICTVVEVWSHTELLLDTKGGYSVLMLLHTYFDQAKAEQTTDLDAHILHKRWFQL